MVTRNASFVLNLEQLNICFLSVITLDFFGVLCVMCLELTHQDILHFFFNNWSKLDGTKPYQLLLIGVVAMCLDSLAHKK